MIALDLHGLSEGDRNNGEGDDDNGGPKMVGQFVPESAPGLPPLVWGVAIRPSDNVIFLSDIGSGLWIVKATGRAAVR